MLNRIKEKCMRLVRRTACNTAKLVAVVMAAVVIVACTMTIARQNISNAEASTESEDYGIFEAADAWSEFQDSDGYKEIGFRNPEEIYFAENNSEEIYPELVSVLSSEIGQECSDDKSAEAAELLNGVKNLIAENVKETKNDYALSDDGLVLFSEEKIGMVGLDEEAVEIYAADRVALSTDEVESCREWISEISYRDIDSTALECDECLNCDELAASMEQMTSETLSAVSEDVEKEKAEKAEKEKAAKEEQKITTGLKRNKKSDKEYTTSEELVYKYNKKNVKEITDEEYEVLCRIVEAEAGDQDVYGRILVANVIMNRVRYKKEFANDIIGVVFETNQFAPTRDGSYYRVTVSDTTMEAVDRCLQGEDYSQGALYFFMRSATSKSKASWFDTLNYLFKYGCHEFFK